MHAISYWLQLSFRTLVREAGEPNGNADFLAAKFRDELMPSRKELHRQKSPVVTIGRVSSWCAAAKQL